LAARSTSTGPEIRITLISVGAGQCAVVRTSDHHAVLIDVGSDTVSDLRRRLLTPYLRAVGCSSVDEVILSHGDYDHIGGAAEVFQDYGQPPFFVSPQFARQAKGNVPAEELLETLFDADRPPKIIHQGDHLDLPGGATLDVLWPPVNCDMNSNNCGLVLKLEYAGRTVIFPADIQEPAERELLKNPKSLKCDVLIAPHHGSAETTTAGFLRAADPQMILASNAAKLSLKQRVFDALAMRRPLYRTSRYGAITITIDAAGRISIDTFLPSR
jgi:competence protein ComEC